MNPRERVLAALGRAIPDRPPISFWGHVYHRESSAAELVAHTVERWERYRWDWIKLNPRKHYHVEPWGVRYDYPGVADQKPRLAEYPVRAAADWAAIGEVPHDAGALGEQLEAVSSLRHRVPIEVPILQTVFTPLAILGELTEPPGVLRAHLHEAPDAVLGALERVTRTFERYVRGVMTAGADGIFLATVDWGCAAFVDEALLRRFSRPFDLRLLAAAGASPFHTLHVCKDHALLDAFADYPVGAFSWDALAPGNLSLAEAMTRLPGAMMGGVSHESAILASDPREVVEQLTTAWRATGGRRWLAAPGCSVPPTTPAATFAALRAAIETPPR